MMVHSDKSIYYVIVSDTREIARLGQLDYFWVVITPNDLTSQNQVWKWFNYI